MSFGAILIQKDYHTRSHSQTAPCGRSKNRWWPCPKILTSALFRLSFCSNRTRTGKGGSLSLKSNPSGPCSSTYRNPFLPVDLTFLSSFHFRAKFRLASNFPICRSHPNVVIFLPLLQFRVHCSSALPCSIVLLFHLSPFNHPFQRATMFLLYILVGVVAASSLDRFR